MIAKHVAFLVVVAVIAGLGVYAVYNTYAQVATTTGTDNGTMLNTGTRTNNTGTGTSNTSGNDSSGGPIQYDAQGNPIYLDSSQTTPGVPNTGLGGDSGALLATIFLSGILMVGGVAYFVREQLSRT